MRVYRGEVYLVDFGIGFGSEQGGIRPAVIVQNNTGNKYSPTTIVVPVASRQTKRISRHTLESKVFNI